MSMVYTQTLQKVKEQTGFAVAEFFMIVIIIAILSLLGTTVFARMNNREYDESVQTDLTRIAQKINAYHAENGSYPTTEQLSNLELTVTKAAYGGHYSDGNDSYNLLYCRAPGVFSLLAYSRSGNGYAYGGDGKVMLYTGSTTSTHSMCADTGIATGEYSWQFERGNWRSYIAG